MMKSQKKEGGEKAGKYSHVNRQFAGRKNSEQSELRKNHSPVDHNETGKLFFYVC